MPPRKRARAQSDDDDGVAGAGASAEAAPAPATSKRPRCAAATKAASTRARPKRAAKEKAAPPPAPPPVSACRAHDGGGGGSSFPLESYPHILDSILENAPLGTVLALAATCKALRAYLSWACVAVVAVNKPGRVGITGLGTEVLAPLAKPVAMDDVPTPAAGSRAPLRFLLDVAPTTFGHPYKKALPGVARLMGPTPLRMVRYPAAYLPPVPAATCVAVLHDIHNPRHRTHPLTPYRAVLCPPQGPGFPVVHRWAMALPMNWPPQAIYRALPKPGAERGWFYGSQILPRLTVIHLQPPSRDEFRWTAVDAGNQPNDDGRFADIFIRLLRDLAVCLRVSDPKCRVVVVGADTPDAAAWTGCTPATFNDERMPKLMSYAYRYPPNKDRDGKPTDPVDDRSREELATQFVFMSRDEYSAQYGVTGLDLALECGAHWSAP